MSISRTELKQSVRFFRHASRLNVHTPSVTSNHNVPGRSSLAVISQGKLQKESISRTPDLRRCLGHHGVFRRCMKAAQEATSQPIQAPRGDNGEGATLDNSAKHDSPVPPIHYQITRAIKAMTQRRHAGALNQTANELVQVPAHSPPRKSNVVDSLQYGVKLVFRRKSLSEGKSVRLDTAG
ncbi:hypothetical protein BDV29DRAFT_155721 [Aspergillus leporis]|jgi:hypothetical protein|uniref:Uncharacterized protein n=1 Tax=Aspergillus leporis TaxID=41062 RepID=A0A5N5X5M7_9EURO|nr:hypothetical protein BDV29DRAFT_155721 [Aspergillus leporis]